MSLYRFADQWYRDRPVTVMQVVPGGTYRLMVEHEGRSWSLHDADGTLLKFDEPADARHWAQERGMEVRAA